MGNDLFFEKGFWPLQKWNNGFEAMFCKVKIIICCSVYGKLLEINIFITIPIEYLTLTQPATSYLDYEWDIKQLFFCIWLRYNTVRCKSSRYGLDIVKYYV